MLNIIKDYNSFFNITTAITSFNLNRTFEEIY
jgi:hypothetical protein